MVKTEPPLTGYDSGLTRAFPGCSRFQAGGVFNAILQMTAPRRSEAGRREVRQLDGGSGLGPVGPGFRNRPPQALQIQPGARSCRASFLKVSPGLVTCLVPFAPPRSASSAPPGARGSRVNCLSAVCWPPAPSFLGAAAWTAYGALQVHYRCATVQTERSGGRGGNPPPPALARPRPRLGPALLSARSNGRWVWFCLLGAGRPCAGTLPPTPPPPLLLESP